MPQLYLARSPFYSSEDIAVPFPRPSRANPVWNKLLFAPCWHTWATATPSPVPSCEDLAVSAGSVPKTGFVPVLEDYFIASSLQRSQENRGGGGQEQGWEGSCLQPCFQLVRKVPVSLLHRMWLKLSVGLATLLLHIWLSGRVEASCRSTLVSSPSSRNLPLAKPQLPVHSLVQAKQVFSHTGLQLSSCLFHE